MKKLYETDSMLREIEAEVLSCTQDSQGIRITLDKSIFFPEGGGQYADEGLIIVPGNVEPVHVLDGQEIKTDNGRQVVYTVDSEIAPGTTALCKLNWNLRFRRMQQHSGEHVLTGIIHNTYGYNNTSFHLSDDEPVTVCFSGSLTQEQIASVEHEANRVIYENLPIVDTYPSKSELENLTYRSKIEIEGQVRIITVGSGSGIIDVCACCAPHVPSTAYIGMIKIMSFQSYKGGTQLNILCGERAYEALKDEHKLLMDMSHEFSTSIEALSETVITQREKLNNAENELAGIKEAAYLDVIDKMGAEDVPVFFAPDMSAHAMKITYNRLTDKYDGFCGVFSGDDENGYRFYAGNPNLNSCELAGVMREKLDAKGGGSKEMIQGKLAKSALEISVFFKELRS